jgi:hypothetical protein
MMRRLLSLVAVTAFTVAATLSLTFPTSVPAHAAPAASFTWPSDPVRTGEVAKMTVTGHSLEDTTRVYLFKAQNYPEGAFEKFEYIDPTSPTVTINLSTQAPGEQAYIVTVGGVEGDRTFVDRDDYTLTVTAAVATLDVTFPSGPLKVHQKAKVTGQATGMVGRTVLIQHQTLDGAWVTLASTRTKADRTFSINAPTSWATGLRLRAYAPPTANDGAVESTQTTLLAVKPTYKPKAGTATPVAFPRNDARWNPCAPITYQVNRTSMPTGGLLMVKQQLGKISEATGLRFTYTGKTNFVAMKGRSGAKFSPSSDLTVSWASSKTVPALRKNPGVGGAKQVTGPTGQGEIVKAYVVMDAKARLSKNQAANKTALEKVLLHQLGHAVGLADTKVRTQVMNEKSRVQPRFGAGDLAGLATVGADHGCVGATT